MTKKNLNPGEPYEDTFSDDENRIDWERRQKSQRRDEEVTEDLVDDFDQVDVDVLLEPRKKQRRGKKEHRRKRRQLVMDEDRGQYVVKRRRKGNRRFDDWYDDYE